MHRKQRRFDSHEYRLVEFHRAHGINDARRDETPLRARLVVLPLRPVSANPPRAYNALRLLAELVLVLLVTVTFEFLVLEPIARQVLKAGVAVEAVTP